MKKYIAVLLSNKIKILVILFCTVQLSAQNNTDSLKQLLKNPISDTVIINTTQKLANIYRKKQSYDTAYNYAFENNLFIEKKIAQLTDKKNPYLNTLNKKRLSALLMYSSILQSKSNYSIALKNYDKSLLLSKSLNDSMSIASSYLGIASCYSNQGNYVEATTNFFSALTISEKINDDNTIVAAYRGLGQIYRNQKRYEEALDMLAKSLAIAIKLNNKIQISAVYSSMATVYGFQKKYDQSLQYHNKAFKIDEQQNNKNGMVASYVNVGTILVEIGKYSEAIQSYEKALKLANELGDKNALAIIYNNIAEVFIKQKNTKEARIYLNKSLVIANDIQRKYILEGLYVNLTTVDTLEKDYVQAFKHYLLKVAYRDSMNNEKNTKAITQAQMQYEFSQKEAIAEAEQMKKQLIYTEELKRKNIFIYAGIILLGLLVVFFLFMYSRYKLIQKQNKIIESQSAVIEKVNKSLQDGINNAQSIQNNILPSPDYMRSLIPSHFIFYSPKEVVSGDFYWCNHIGNKVYLAVADCTGHGVSGALMSMLGYSFINEIFLQNKNNNLHPSQLLDLLNKKVIDSAKNKITDADVIEGGMDISICCIDKDTNLLHVASANQSVYIIKNNTIECIDGDFNSIGWQLSENTELYTAVTIPLEKDMCIYLSTDGYKDQYGGPNNKKFSTTQFEDLLLKIYSKSIAQQQAQVTDSFAQWQGKLNQIDDVLVIGLKTS